MKVLNLINEEKGDVSFSISKFPDGEVHITLGELDHKNDLLVKCRITNAEELFILMQVCDILRRHGIIFKIYIYYLMSARMDRVMDFNRPYSLSIVCDILDNLGATDIFIYECHSDVIYDLIKKTIVHGLGTSDIEKIVGKNKHQLVLPDKGAASRYGDELYMCNIDYILFNKVRDLSTGSITSIECTNPEDIIKNTPLLVYDDLCDAGGTFVSVASELRKLTDNKIDIFVHHMVNRKGIENLSKNYDKVFFTNSYKTWNNLPDNVTQIEII